LNLYTDNIRAFVQAKAKASDELNKIKARVAGIQAELAAIVSPPVAAAAPKEEPAAPVVAAPVPAPVAAPAPAAPAENKPAAPVADDGFADVVPTDLQDLVAENAPPLPEKSDFEQGTDILPEGIQDVIAESENAEPLSESPFENLLPTDTKDLLEPSVEGDALADIDDGEFEALKQEAGLGDVDEGRRLSSTEADLTTLLFGGANFLAL